MGRRRHAGCATGTLGGAPCGATKRVSGVPKQRHAESKSKEGEEGEERRGNAGRRLFKTRTQDHMMFGKSPEDSLRNP
eukprot:791951-Pyramimonas_sp.AAC.1